MDPGKVQEPVAFLLHVANAIRFVFGAIRDLIIVSTEGCDQAELVFGRAVENQRAEAAQAVPSIVDHGRGRRLEAEIGAVSIHPGVVGEALGVTAESKLVIGLVKTTVCGYEFALARSLKPTARDHVEDAVSAVAIF